MSKIYNLMIIIGVAVGVALPIAPMYEVKAAVSADKKLNAVDIKLDRCKEMIADNTSAWDWLEWEVDLWALPMLSRSSSPDLTFADMDSDEMDIGPNRAWEIITKCRKLRGE